MNKEKKGALFVITLVLLLIYVSKKNVTFYSYEEYYRDSIVATNAEINAQLERKNLKMFIRDSLTLCYLSSDSITKLVLRLTDSQCDMCIDVQYLLLSKYMQDMKQQMIIMGTSSKRNNYKGRKLVNDIIEIPDSVLTWEPEFYNAPYYFILHPDLAVSHFFVPDKNYEELTRCYLEKISCLIKDELIK